MEYTDDNRGMIQYHKRMAQVVSFKGMRYGNTTPTDIDGILEWSHKNAYVIYELKRQGAEVPTGQRLALENIVRDFVKAGKHALAVICCHNVTDPNDDIILGDSIVREYFCGSEWRHPETKWTCKEITDYYWRKLDSGGRL